MRIKSHATKKALFREEDLTYNAAYKIATAMEEAEKNASSTDNISNVKSTDNTSVNVIQSQHKKEKSRQSTPGGREEKMRIVAADKDGDTTARRRVTAITGLHTIT